MTTAFLSLLVALVVLVSIDNNNIIAAALKITPRSHHHYKNQRKWSSVHDSDTRPIVVTRYGAVQGTSDQGAFAFRAIPYAIPPLYMRRFSPPEPMTPWSGVLDGSEFSSGCIAHCSNKSFPRPELMCPPTVSEDCLYMNIFTPYIPGRHNHTNNSTNKNNTLLPVLIFIHGGNYIGGAGGVPLYDGSVLAVKQQLVVVTFNYRLGLIGGLYTGTTFTGNYQTMDQRQAMKFVSEIISSFGGDPKRVTLAGQSAGAYSVGTHLSSPASWPYFHGAIMLSNPFSLPVQTKESAKALGEHMLKILHCYIPDSPEEEHACLNYRTPDALLAAQDERYVNMSELLRVPMQWTPVVDGEVLLYSPIEALTNGHFHKVPILFGTTANESVEFIYAISSKPLPPIGYDAMIAMIFGLDEGKAAIEEYAPIPPKFQNDTRNYMTVLGTDYIFYCSARMVGRALTQQTKTFMYYFDIDASWSNWTYNATMPYCVDAVCHADDLPFYFDPFNAPMPPGVRPPQPTEQENTLINFMQTMWGNFAYTGSPNPLPQNITFPLFNGTSNILVNLSTPVSMLAGYRDTYCDFWDKWGYTKP